MAKIVKEPFAPKKRYLKRPSFRLGLRRILAVLSLKTQSEEQRYADSF